MSVGVELTYYSPFATMDDLQQVKRQHNELRVKCQKMEELIQKLLKKESDHLDSTQQVEEECSASFIGQQQHDNDACSSSFVDQSDKQATQDCHIIDISLGIYLFLRTLTSS